jgi:16S rRNA pseudouridine516 synthase
MMAAVGNHVLSLHREAIGNIELGDLPEGECRDLTEKEIRSIDRP